MPETNLSEEPDGWPPDRCSHCERVTDDCECLFCESCDRECTDSRCEHCNNCTRRCCECTFCSRCNDRFDGHNGPCSSCERCSDCCECRFCERCSDECSDNYCSDCDNCESCCECASDKWNPSFFTNDAHFWPAARTERKRNQSGRFIAAEIEVASVGRDFEGFRVVRRWRGSIVRDGSLPKGGFEINTAPASGDKFMQQVDEICEELNLHNAEVTHACGLHVHIDARDFDYYTVRRLARVYAEIESALFGMLPSRRRTSSYCRPCGAQYRDMAAGIQRYKYVKNQVIERVYDRPVSRDTPGQKRHKYESARYNALNLHSWFYRGTIECRMFVGTTNAHKIQSWGRIWATILDRVSAMTDADTDKFVSDTRPPAQKLLSLVEGQSDLEAFIRGRIEKYSPAMLQF